MLVPYADPGAAGRQCASIRVRTVRSVFKLSQDMPPEVRDRVREDLCHHGNAPFAAVMAERPS